MVALVEFILWVPRMPLQNFIHPIVAEISLLSLDTVYERYENPISFSTCSIHEGTQKEKWQFRSGNSIVMNNGYTEAWNINKKMNKILITGLTCQCWRVALLLNMCSHEHFFVMIWITKTQIHEVKQPTDRIPTEICLPYNIVMHLRSAELKAQSEMVHSKWKQYWQWIWETLAAVYEALYPTVTLFPSPC